jgi:hypothetical protein
LADLVPTRILGLYSEVYSIEGYPHNEC